MDIKVKKTTATSGQTSSTLVLTAGLKLPDTVKTRIKNDVGDFLVEKILATVGQAKSPVAGGDWKSTLSPEYKKKKLSEGLSGKADMELEGDMLNDLTFKETSDGIDIGWFGDQAPKADGHNNFSGKSDLPRRQSLPEEGQEFISGIQKEIEKIVSDAIADEVEFNQADFEDVSSKAELYSALEEYFPGFSPAEIRDVVARSPDLARLLDDLGIFELL